jgi:hypothetical protein
LQISCHKDNQRLINSDYIYRISYKNAKKAEPKPCLFCDSFVTEINYFPYFLYIVYTPYISISH